MINKDTMIGSSTILFVDDEIRFLDSIKRLLRNHREWDLVFATSVAEAVGYIRDLKIDLVVSDVQMPEQTGFDLLKILQDSDNLKDIPVIMLTGSAEVSLKREALELGATDLLNKPINYEDLRARLSSSLKLKIYQDRIKNHNIILEQEVEKRTFELQILHQDVIWRLAKAGELRDEDTGNHLIRVACYCKLLAEKLGLGRQKSNLISFTSCLHDLGKIGVPDAILLKNGKLSESERTIMEKHCQLGEAILRDKPKAVPLLQNLYKDDAGAIKICSQDQYLETAAIIACTHHEKWDGSGYPHGLKGKEIPIEGRITALADVYDALRSKRPYKEPFEEKIAIEIIAEGRMTHFDPELVDLFLEHRESFAEINERYY